MRTCCILAVLSSWLLMAACAGPPLAPPCYPKKVRVVLLVVDERGEVLKGVELELEPISGSGPDTVRTGAGGLASLPWEVQARAGRCVVELGYRAWRAGSVEARGRVREQWPVGGAGGPGVIYREITLASLEAVAGPGLGPARRRVCVELYRQLERSLRPLGLAWRVPAFKAIPGGIRARMVWKGGCWGPVEAAGARTAAVVCAVVPVVGAMARAVQGRLKAQERIEIAVTAMMPDPRDPYAPSRRLKLVVATSAARLEALGRGEISAQEILAHGLEITEEKSR